MTCPAPVAEKSKPWSGTDDEPDWAEGVLQGGTRAAARAISLIENDDPRSDDLVRRLYPHTGHAYALGFTGPPGAGKSTIVDGIVHLTRQERQRAGVIAVDPNSPFSGGAILGDRIRMMRHTVDPDVFIRSMGSRGHLGGLALATSRAMYVLDALGMDYIVLETVGVGQSELEVAGLADTTVVVVMPGLGDSVQTIKAGIMEIADIFVVNKADHAAAQKTVTDLTELLRIDSRRRNWTPSILKTVATREEGMRELWEAIGAHRRFLEESGELQSRRRHRVQAQIVEVAARKLRDQVLGLSTESESFQITLRRVVQREIDPFSAAQTLVDGSMRAGAWHRLDEVKA